MPVDQAIKELIGEELVNLKDLHARNEERFVSLERALQDLSGRVEERAREGVSLREDVDSLRKRTDDLDVRAKALESFDSHALTGRVGRLESDEDGNGGVKQIRDRLETLTREFRDVQLRLEENGRICASAKSLTDEFDVLLRGFGKQCEDSLESMQKCQGEVDRLAKSNEVVNSAQQALEDSVARKYERLWEDVLHAIEEFKTNILEEQRADFERRRDGGKIEAKNAVSYALNVLRCAHEERRRLVFSRDLVIKWREQTWIGTRRRMGIWRLHCLAQRRHREVVQRWCRRTEVACLATHFSQSINPPLESAMSQINAIRDVTAQLQSDTLGIEHRCAELEVLASGLKETACTKELLAGSLAEHSSSLQSKITESGASIQGFCEVSVASLQTLHGEIVQRVEGLDSNLSSRLSEHTVNITELGETLKEYARAKEVQGMMRDTLLMWNSIKQLDAAKADRKDLDAFAAESSGRERLSSQRLEELEEEIATRVRAAASCTDERYSDLEGRIAENSNHFKHWEQMWEKLATYVEDLVAKIASLQSVAQMSSTVRPGLGSQSRPSSRDRLEYSTDADPVRNSTKMPPPLPLTMVSSEASTLLAGEQGLLPRGVNSRDSSPSRLVWLGSARSLTDAKLEEVAEQAKLGFQRPRAVARPRSANGRRPIDVLRR